MADAVIISAVIRVRLRISAAVLVAGIAFSGLSGCSSQSPEPGASTATDNAPPTTVEPPSSTTVAATPSDVETSAVSPSSNESESDLPTEPGEGDGSSPPKLGPDDAGRTLTFKDLRNWADLAEDFGDDTFKIGNKPVQAIGGRLRGCGAANSTILDLRPAQQFRRLSFLLGQDADRTETGSTSQILVAQVLGNDAEVLVTKRAKITSPTTVEADIEGVVVAQIALFLDESRCSYDNEVTAVIADLKLG